MERIPCIRDGVVERGEGRDGSRFASGHRFGRASAGVPAFISLSTRRRARSSEQVRRQCLLVVPCALDSSRAALVKSARWRRERRGTETRVETRRPGQWDVEQK